MRDTTPQRIVKWIVFIIFAFYAMTLLFPFAWMLLNSFKTNSDFVRNIWGFPKKIIFDNYINAFIKTTIPVSGKKYNIASMFGFSIFITLSATVINTFLSTCVAYVVAKYKFVGRNILFSIALFALILPTAGTLVAQYKLMTALKLTNTIVGLLILYSGSFGFTFFIMQGIFKGISWTYAEAAFIDGASDFKVFIKIMIPMAWPTMVSLAVIYSIGIWNDYTTPSLYLRKYPTLAVGMRNLTDSLQKRGAYSEMFAAMLVSLIPILVLFISFQKTIMENTIAGGLKG